MRVRNGYRDFVDKTFREIDDLEKESKKHPLLNALRECGLTLQEAGRRYYKRGMSSRQFLEAIKADREKK